MGAKTKTRGMAFSSRKMFPLPRRAGRGGLSWRIAAEIKKCALPNTQTHTHTSRANFSQRSVGAEGRRGLGPKCPSNTPTDTMPPTGADARAAAREGGRQTDTPAGREPSNTPQHETTRQHKTTPSPPVAPPLLSLSRTWKERPTQPRESFPENSGGEPAVHRHRGRAARCELLQAESPAPAGSKSKRFRFGESGARERRGMEIGGMFRFGDQSGSVRRPKWFGSKIENERAVGSGDGEGAGGARGGFNANGQKRRQYVSSSGGEGNQASHRAPSPSRKHSRRAPEKHGSKQQREAAEIAPTTATSRQQRPLATPPTTAATTGLPSSTTTATTTTHQQQGC